MERNVRYVCRNCKQKVSARVGVFGGRYLVRCEHCCQVQKISVLPKK